MQMTPEWKARVRDELVARGVGPAWLAEQLGLRTHHAVSKMLDPAKGQQTSALVPGVCEILGVPPPLAPPTPEDEARFVELFRGLSERRKQALFEFLSSDKGDTPKER